MRGRGNINFPSYSIGPGGNPTGGIAAFQATSAQTVHWTVCFRKRCLLPPCSTPAWIRKEPCALAQDPFLSGPGGNRTRVRRNPHTGISHHSHHFIHSLRQTPDDGLLPLVASYIFCCLKALAAEVLTSHDTRLPDSERSGPDGSAYAAKANFSSAFIFNSHILTQLRDLRMASHTSTSPSKPVLAHVKHTG